MSEKAISDPIARWFEDAVLLTLKSGGPSPLSMKELVTALRNVVCKRGGQQVVSWQDAANYCFGAMNSLLDVGYIESVSLDGRWAVATLRDPAREPPQPYRITQLGLSRVKQAIADRSIKYEHRKTATNLRELLKHLDMGAGDTESHPTNTSKESQGSARDDGGKDCGSGEALGESVIPNPKVVERSYSMAEIRDMTDLKNITLNKYARVAGIPIAGRGKQNFRYSVSDTQRLLKQILGDSGSMKIKEKCKQALAGLAETGHGREDKS